MLATITIDYSLRPATVDGDRRAFDISNLDEVGLRKLGKGRLFVIDNKNRNFFVVESQVLDYANQLVGVAAEFNRGNYETFAVSPDFFSNNLRFKYSPQSKQVEVSEVNGGSFCVSFVFSSFEYALKRFYSDLLAEYQSHYPELAHNGAFQNMRVQY